MGMVKMAPAECAGSAKREPWYRHHRFALVPSWRTRPADRWNTWSAHIHWLFFRAWTMDSPEIGVGVTLNDQNFMITARLPYLAMGMYIPLLPMSLGMKLWRRPDRGLE